MEIDRLKQMLGLKPLPGEGGFYVESYRSDERWEGKVLRRDGGDRCLGTAIYFLLTSETFSALHKLSSDEIYHFYVGDPLEILLLREDGSGEVAVMGSDLENGMRPQLVVPRGTWQGSRVRPGGKFALMGTTVAPGFEFSDCQLGRREFLVAQYPKFSDLIRKLTR